MPIERGLAGRVAGRGGLRDRGGVDRRAAVAAVVGGDRGAADPGLDAARGAAVAAQAGALVVAGPGQGVVAPFAGEAVGPLQHPAVHRDAAAAAGAQDHAEHHRRARAGAVGRLGERQAVGVVGERDRLPEPRGEVGVQRLAVQAGGVGVLHAAVGPRRAGRADAHAERPAGRVARSRDQPGDRVERGAVVVGGRRHARAPAFAAVRVEQQGLDLGAAEVDAERRAGGGAGSGGRGHGVTSRRGRPGSRCRHCSEASVAMGGLVESQVCCRGVD